MNKKVPLALSLAAIAGVLLVVLEVHLPDHLRLRQEIQNFGHVPLFGMMSLAVLTLSGQLLGSKLNKRYLYCAAAFAAAGSQAFRPALRHDHGSTWPCNGSHGPMVDDS